MNKQIYLIDFILKVRMEIPSHSALDAYNQAMSVAEQPYANLRLAGQAVKLITIRLAEGDE